jgi:multiple sugar transport system permease protein
MSTPRPAGASPSRSDRAAVGAAIMLTPMIWTLLLSFKSNAGADGRQRGGVLRPLHARELSLDLRRLAHDPLAAEQPDRVARDHSRACSSCVRWRLRLRPARVPVRRTLFIFVLLGSAIPEQAVICRATSSSPTSVCHNSYPGLVLPGLTGSFGVFFMTQYFRAIPRELDEAACARRRLALRHLPGRAAAADHPGQATLGVFTFLGSWNDYWWPLISATTSDYFTLTVGLASAQMNYAQTSGLGFLMAQAVFASIPILIVYIIFQKQIVRAMAGAAVR